MRAERALGLWLALAFVARGFARFARALLARAFVNLVVVRHVWQAITLDNGHSVLICMPCHGVPHRDLVQGHGGELRLKL